MSKMAAISSAARTTPAILHFGIREHGMCSILNGMALHGGFIPFGSSFLVFTDYAGRRFGSRR